MSHRKQFVKTFDRSSRTDYRSQRDKLRSVSPTEIVEDSDYVEELLRYADRVETRKARSGGRALAGELGETPEVPKRRLQRIRLRLDGGDEELL